MQFLLISTLVALASATPIIMNGDEASIERRQVKCTIMGEEDDTISSNAPASGVAGTSVGGWLVIKCEDGRKWDSGNSLPNSQTVKAKDTGFEKDVHWTQKWEVGGYKSCSVSYGDGNPTIDGKVGDNDIQMAIGASSKQSSTCGAEFFI